MARLMSEAAAAKEVGLEPATFRAWVKSGQLPETVPGTGKYDIKAVHVALDRKSGLGAAQNALDAWLETENED